MTVKIAGIISEYNPFHKGHIYHIKETKKLLDNSNIISIMSGNFVQRGEPAIFEKKKRAKKAVENGVDLVLELPFVFAAESSYYFARGAIDILNSLGIVDYLSFGSESGDIKILQEIASFLSDEKKEYKNILNSHLKEGSSLQFAREKALEKYFGKRAKILRKPNNILAIEYLIALKNTKIKPITIKRNMNFKSAHSIREEMGINLDYYDKILFEILRLGRIGLSEIFEIKEGIENRIYDKTIKFLSEDKNFDFQKLIKNINSKRYSDASIKRIFINILMNYKRNDAKKIYSSEKKYANILSYSEIGKKLLKKIKKEKNNNLSLFHNINKEYKYADEEEKLKLNYDIKAEKIYSYCYNK